MRKLILFGLVLFSTTFLLAKDWIVTTTCGQTATLHTTDDVTVSQLTYYVSLINYDKCHTYPRSVEIVL